MTGQEIEFIGDENGVAVTGEPDLVDEFLSHIGAGPALTALSGFGELAAENSGKWVRLSDDSAALLKKYGATINPDTGLAYGVLRAEGGKIGKHLEFVPVPGRFNPVMLTGIGGVLAQMAAEQQMAEITGYLESIDTKLDAVLQDLKDSLFAELEGAGAVVDKALVLREHTGRINEVTWSQVEGVQETIARTQSKVLRRLRNLADSLADARGVSDRLAVLEDAEAELADMLGALAEAFRLQEAYYVLELERVRETDPADAEAYQRSLAETRRATLESMALVTTALLEQIQAAGVVTSGQRVRSAIRADRLLSRSNAVATEVATAQRALGLSGEIEALEGQTWLEALREIGDSTVDATKQRVDDVRSLAAKVSDEVRERRIGRMEKKLESLKEKRDG